MLVKLDKFSGKQIIVKSLKIHIERAKIENRQLAPIILHGPVVTGKTALAEAIADEMNVNIISTIGSLINNQADLFNILSRIKSGDVLFIDEIHSLKKDLLEIIYMDLDAKPLLINVGKIPYIEKIEIDIPKHTVIAATTNYEKLTHSLKSRFTINLHLDLLSDSEIAEIVIQNLNKDILIDQKIVKNIAFLSCGNPRNAVMLSRRYNDFFKSGIKEWKNILPLLGFNKFGLTEIQNKYLMCFAATRTLSISSLSALLCEGIATVLLEIEPALLRRRLIDRTNKGRVLTKQGLNYVFKYKNNEDFLNEMSKNLN